MKRSDRIKLDFIRNWKLPGRKRLSHMFSPSDELKGKMKDGIVWLTAEDIAIYTSADNYIEWTIFSTGTYEDDTNKLIRISARPGATCLDIGGNIGLQSIRMAQAVGPAGKVFAFEPLQHLQTKFRRNVALNCKDNVTLLPFALSDQQGESEFAIDEHAWNQGTFSLLESTGATMQQVQIKVADELPEIQSLTDLCLIKIDVEGFEFHVLRGLKQTLTKHRPRLIFEYDHHYWKRTGEDVTKCFTYLTGLGYTIYQVTSVGCELIPTAADVRGGNLFCIPA